MKTIAINT